MIFRIKPDLLIESENRSTKIQEYFPINETYFYSALEFVNELNEEYRNESMALLEITTSTNDMDVLNESFENFSKSILNAVEKAIEFIKKKIDDILFFIQKNSVKNKLLISKSSNVLNKFNNSDHAFDSSIYKYTDKLIDPSIPPMDSLFDKDINNKILNNIDIIIKMVSRDISNKTIDSSIQKIKDLIDDQLDIDMYGKLEDFRGKLLGTNAKIKKEEFASFIKEELLGGEKINTLVDKNVLKSAYDFLGVFNQLLNELKQAKNKIKSEYDALKKSFSLIQGIVGLQLNKENMSVFSKQEIMQINKYVISRAYNIFHKTIVSRMNEHILALSSKLDCLKIIYVQSISIIREATNRVKQNIEENDTDTSTPHDEDTYSRKRIAVSSESTLFGNIECDDYDFYENNMMENSYDMFLLKEYCSQYSYRYSINEFAIANNVEPIFEAGSLKDILDKIVSKIRDMYGVFTKFIGDTTKINDKFLASNKDTILKNKFKEKDNTNNDNILKRTHKYDLSKIQSSDIPSLNYESMKEELNSDEAFIKAHFSEFSSTMKEDVSFRDVVKTVLCGGSLDYVDIKVSELNPVDIYNFCYTFNNNIYSSIKKDIQTVQNANVELTKYIKNIQSKSNVSAQNASYNMLDEYGFLSEKSLTTTQRDKLSNSDFGIPELKKYPMPDKKHVISAIGYFNKVDPNYEKELANNILSKMKEYDMFDSVHVSKENKFYKYVKKYLKEDFIFEAEVGSEQGNKDNSSPVDVDKVKKDIENTSNNSSDDIKSVSKRINVYFKTCGDYLGAKLTVSRWVYLDYMKLLKWHAKQFGGTENTSNDKAADNDTNDEPIDITSAETHRN